MLQSWGPRMTRSNSTKADQHARNQGLGVGGDAESVPAPQFDDGQRRRPTRRRTTRSLRRRSRDRAGTALANVAHRLYQASADAEALWRLTQQAMGELNRSDRIAYFNAKKFLSFQTAKLLDRLQNPFRRTYQSLELNYSTQSAKGPYAVFDNVTAIFSATPVIARTATYVLRLRRVD